MLSLILVFGSYGFVEDVYEIDVYQRLDMQSVIGLTRW